MQMQMDARAQAQGRGQAMSKDRLCDGTRLNSQLPKNQLLDYQLLGYQQLREMTEAICARLEIEDTCVQPQAHVSPPKWHLGHTTWFFETFCVRDFDGSDSFSPEYPYVFNSYYEAAGARVPQSQRGILSRPLLRDVLAYRWNVDERLEATWARLQKEGDLQERARFLEALELGLHHEQQHQELLLMDIKAIFFAQPVRPALFAPLGMEAEKELENSLDESSDNWLEVPSGLHDVGARSEGFAFDNERPRHRVFLEGGCIRESLASNAEYLEFIRDRGYERPEFWLSEGWAWVQSERVRHPLYWIAAGDSWREYTLHGEHELALRDPVSHVSFYEADAFACWCGRRLPTEFEWEVVAERVANLAGKDSFFDGARAHPSARLATRDARASFFGQLWQWTASPYVAYPGFRPFHGLAAEYNGKFMSGQMVLRGGCRATPRGHMRTSYRNFFSPASRWMFSGIRVAR